MPHLGQRPGWSLVTSGCIGAVGDRTRAFWHGGWIVDLSDQRQRLVGWCGQPAIQLLPLGGQLRCSPQHLEFSGQ